MTPESQSNFNILTFHIQKDTIKCLQDLHTVLQPLLRFKQARSSVVDSKEITSASVYAAFIYMQILSLTRGNLPSYEKILYNSCNFQGLTS